MTRPITVSNLLTFSSLIEKNVFESIDCKLLKKSVSVDIFQNCLQSTESRTNREVNVLVHRKSPDRLSLSIYTVFDRMVTLHRNLSAYRLGHWSDPSVVVWIIGRTGSSVE
ncbi:hypothetical protein Droror1_Dr00005155 [Drosera rotundifolia]